MLVNFKGPCSWFGGPNDTGVDTDEGLAFFYDYNDAPHLFLDEQPSGTSGLARRLDPEIFYVACRWDYDITPKDMLREKDKLAVVRAGGREFLAWPSDWGPHSDTNRVADISPGLMEALGITTDDEVEVEYPVERPTMGLRVAMSSGHGRHIRGASGILDEVAQARYVVQRTAMMLRQQGVETFTFHDNESDDQSENLHRIVDWHNAQIRELDVSVHFNAYEPTEEPMGTECLYVTQDDLAMRVADAISDRGNLINRGAKQRNDLYFLNNTTQPAILIEVCFVDSSADVEQYQENFHSICLAIADAIIGS